MTKPMRGQRWRPPSALQQQGWDDAAEDYMRRRQISTAAPQPFQPRPTDIVKVKNNTSADRSRGDVVKISGTPLSPATAEHPWFNGTAPAIRSNHAFYRYACPDGNTADASVSGWALARVNINDLADTHAYVEPSQYYLESAQSGPHKILINLAGSTGVQDCLILIDGGFPFGWDMVAYVPNGTSIAARSTTRIYSQSLALYYEIDDVSNPGERIITAMVDNSSNPYTELVYNFSNEAVTGPRYVMTSLTASGTRYVVLESCNSD